MSLAKAMIVCLTRAFCLKRIVALIRYNSPEDLAAAGYQGPPQFYKDMTNWTIIEDDSTISGYNVSQDNASFSLQDTQSVQSKGKEIELVYNPTPNWRIAWNISQQQAESSNIRPFTRECLTYRIDEWTSTQPGTPGTLTSDESDEPVNVRIKATLLNGLNTDLAREGANVSEMREWRSNFITNYVFDEDSRFKNFNVGGALRWESEKAIGYPITEKEFDGELLEVPDLDNPYFDDEITRVDLWIGYNTKIMDGKISWKLQLNIRNAFSDGDIVAVRAQPDGSTQSVIWQEGRTFSLRSIFEF